MGSLSQCSPHTETRQRRTIPPGNPVSCQLHACPPSISYIRSAHERGHIVVRFPRECQTDERIARKHVIATLEDIRRRTAKGQR